ncbi:hypothetical protein EVAR_14407_1 [Eumeta japonica]|uniref:Uncharacterized protein n=1 Tax=Eumeta variegata TaxID=151549 RepID=A0A4C1TX96_EUMVA|nr:hypothetical protein EVAR_14407_1 [Eumeta japonica]
MENRTDIVIDLNENSSGPLLLILLHQPDLRPLDIELVCSFAPRLSYKKKLQSMTSPNLNSRLTPGVDDNESYVDITKTVG